MGSKDCANMDSIVDIKKEELDLSVTEAPNLFSNAIKTEVPTNVDYVEFEGIDDIAHSSYSSSISFAHKTDQMKKEKQPSDVMEDRPNFCFVEADIDRAQYFADSTNVDPLQVSNCASTGCEPRQVKQEVYSVMVKQEPGETDGRSMEFGLFVPSRLQSGQDVDPLQISTCASTGCEPRQVKQEVYSVMVKQEPGETDGSSMEFGLFVTLRLQSGQGIVQPASTSPRLTYPSDVWTHHNEEDTKQEHSDKPSESETTEFVQVVSENHSNLPGSMIVPHSPVLCVNKASGSGEHTTGKRQEDTESIASSSQHNDVIDCADINRQDKPWACDQCDKNFTKRSNLKRHKTVHSVSKLIPHARKVCSQKSDLVRHNTTHTYDKHFACVTCPAKFTRNAHLTIHNRTHTGEKPFACVTCPAKFTRNAHLTIHKRMHTGEKPFACDTCPAKFTSTSHLTIHNRTHTGEKPFACDTCPAKFTRNAHLTIHNRTHTGEKPFACVTCPAKFTTNSHLTIHKRTHTGDKPYSCSMCGKRFSESGSLSRHKSTHTGKKT